MGQFQMTSLSIISVAIIVASTHSIYVCFPEWTMHASTGRNSRQPARRGIRMLATTSTSVPRDIVSVVSANEIGGSGPLGSPDSPPFSGWGNPNHVSDDCVVPRPEIQPEMETR